MRDIQTGKSIVTERFWVRGTEVPANEHGTPWAIDRNDLGLDSGNSCTAEYPKYQWTGFLWHLNHTPNNPINNKLYCVLGQGSKF